jgi:hypothetical protein
MRNLLRALAFSLTACLFVCRAYADPFDSNLGLEIDAFLTAQGSPLAGNGSVFYSQGVFFNVDPRLLVAIAGAATNYGISYGPTSCNLDAWGSLPNNPCGSGYSSYTQGIETVAAILRQNYLNLGLTTIPAIATQFCSGPCDSTWITAVTNVYQSLNGNLSTAVTFPGSLIDFENLPFYSPDYFAYYTSWNAPLVISTSTGVTASLYGGVTLSGATNLPGDASTSYGTANPYCDPSICFSEIEIDFSQPVINFSTFLINGNTVYVTYEVQDDTGGYTTVTLVDNFDSGVGTIALPPTDRITKVYIDPLTSGGCCAWDYFIDNVSFAPAP